MIDTTNIAETIARESRKPFALEQNCIGYIALPDGFQLHDTEPDEARPRRKRGTVTLNNVESFIDYIKRHGSLNSSTVWCDAQFQKGIVGFTAILNDHGEDDNTPAWRDHKAIFNPTQSVEWHRWFGKNAAVFSQFDFAQFLEENIKDIATQEGMPTGAQMLEMALAFEANQDMRIKSAMRLQSGGVQLNFVQDDDAQTVAKMQIFERFSIGIPVFENDQGYALNARLRYRTRDGKVSFWFELIRPDRVLEDAAKRIMLQIKDLTGRPFFMGNPF